MPVAVSDGAYRTDSDEKRHHGPNGFRNVGDFRPSEGAGWRHLTTDPYFARVGAQPRKPLSRSAVLRGIEAARNKRFSITWIGHATFLIRMNGTWILTDPFFGERASPVHAAGPKRLYPPALSVADLPEIDLVVISHNHYDHWDSRALAQIARANPKARLLVPLGNAATAQRHGFDNVHEMDWFDTEHTKGISVTAVPAVHSSRRSLGNTDQALWGGWSLAAAGRRLYFAGDTGYGSFINDIRRVIGRHDIALVPIGAYEPQSTESMFHTTPEDAVRLADKLQARHIIPIHWGTIALTPETFDEQAARYQRATAGRKGAHLPRIGETLGFY